MDQCCHFFGHLTREQRSDIQSCYHELLAEHWKLGVTHILQAIWTRKCRYRDITLDNTIFRAKALLQGILQEGRMTLRDITMETITNEAIQAAAIAIFTSFADTSLGAEPVLCTLSGTGFCVLFFDGGARGNPGPGGAGAIIVTRADTPERPHVRWMCSVFLARSSTTNNVAEYKALLFGLRKASKYQLRHIHVVRDSDLILGHLRRRKSPKARHLQDLYRQCRLLVDQLTVATWRHHLRQYKRMADKLANIAMDNDRRIQVLGRDMRSLPPIWKEVTDNLRGDIGHWQEGNWMEAGQAHTEDGDLG